MTLVDNYFPFDTGAGSTATPARWRLMARLWYGSGVVPAYLNTLRPSLAGAVVTVQSGAVWIDGYYGEIDSPKTIGVSGAGMVVARMDPTAKGILLVFVASQTVPTQNPSGIFEVPIMQITGTTTLTGKDIRVFSAPTPSGPVHARACRVGIYYTPTAVTAFGWDTMNWGTGFSGATYTCPINGDYIVFCQAGFVSTAAGQWYNLRLYHNGVSITWNGTNGAQGASQAIVAQIHDIVPCAAGDTLVVYHNCSTANLNGYVGSNVAFMTVRAIP